MLEKLWLKSFLMTNGPVILIVSETRQYVPPNPLARNVVVTFNCQDLGNPPNVMPQETYTFTVSELVIR